MTKKKLLTKKFNYENQPTYIKSIEASDIYEHIKKGTELKQVDYVGMIPFSLELIQLRETGMTEFKKKVVVKKDEDGKPVVVDGKKQYETVYVRMDKRERKATNKFLTDDVINVKFKTVVKDSDEIIDRKEKRYDDKIKAVFESPTLTDEEKAYQIKLLDESLAADINEIANLTNENKDVWTRKVSLELLRKDLYENGFTLMNFEGEPTEYVRYKRSSAKSREGQCLFIKKALIFDEIKVEGETKLVRNDFGKWSHMGLDIKEGTKIDLAGLLSYESLVGSTLIDLVQIPSESILLIDDVDSVFNKKVNVIEKGANSNGGGLISTEGEHDVVNSLWDGQSLLSSEFFPEEKGMMLLRNHFFKSCAFNTNIQTFMEDNKPVEYESLDDWMITDMYGNEMPASSIKFIITPNSLKALKYSDLIGTEAEMYEHWKEFIQVYEGGSYFGVVKHEKETKRGFNEEGMPLQRLSYQMVNSFPLSKEKIQELCSFEKKYIESLKDDNEKYIEFLERTATNVNANDLFVALYKHNTDFGATKLFKDYKKDKIYKYINEVKKGKTRIVGDYLVLCGNPVEMLFSAIGEFDIKDIESHSLKGNEVYAPLFNDGEKLCVIRNPHTSPSNLLFVVNKNKESTNEYKNPFKEYFNFSKNIIAVNTIQFELPDILSGSDFDSDTALVTNDLIINSIRPKEGEEFEYKVCINKISTKKIDYTYSDEQCFKVDKALANSYIGRVVNLGQMAQSIYWNALATKCDNYEEIAKDMKEVIEIVVVLSTVAIDMAKREYDINLSTEIGALSKRVNKYKCTKKEYSKVAGKEVDVMVDPNFFTLIKRRKNKKKQAIDKVVINAHKNAEKMENIDFDEESFNQMMKSFFLLKEELCDAADTPEEIDDESEVEVEELTEDECEVKSEDKPFYYNTPMDYLVEYFSDIKVADTVKTLDIKTLIRTVGASGKKLSPAKADRKQEKEVIEIIESTVNKIKNLKAKDNYDENKEEYNVIINGEIEELNNRMVNRKINEYTMYSVLYHMFIKKTVKKSNILLKSLFLMQEDVFLNTFKKGE